MEDIAALRDDPFAFVLYAFEWGKGELAGFDGPDLWQEKCLKGIRDAIRDGATRDKAILEATASGHGVGKSALVAWLILWAMSTQEDCKGVVTANTETQLKTKTWPELAKWHRLCITGDWFTFTATALFSSDPTHEKTWRFDMVAWSERNTEAFAGLHNKGKRVLLIFDEASAIPDKIWEVSEGALTDSDTQIVWAVFGNPTRAVGRFRECFHRFKHRWNTRHVDSRDAKMTNKSQLQNWIDDYGIDHDFVKVRVLGQFPNASSDTLIPFDVCRKCMGRFLESDVYDTWPKILGVDVARQGSDRTVIFPRQGLAAFKPRVLRLQDTMLVADQVARSWDKWGADACMIDGTGGYGAGVIDRLRQMGYSPLEVQFSSKANDPRFLNKRAEIWFAMAAWLGRGAAIPNLPELERELTSQTYTYNNDKFTLDPKEVIKELIGESPDMADALACTFAYSVLPKDLLGREQKSRHEYNPLTALNPSGSHDYNPLT